MRSDDVPFATSKNGHGLLGVLRRLTPTKAAKAGALALVAGIVLCIAWNVNARLSTPTFEVKASDSTEISESSPGSAGEDECAQVVVYVSGAVAQPGVYSLAEGSRVNDAIVAAGGLADDAQPSQVNLARVVSDGEQIAIPTQEELDASSQAAVQSASGQSGGGTASGLVNINLADAAALETLSGVGPATAQAIIADREQNGPFATIDDLMRVDGIGEKKFAKLKDSICV